MTSLEKTTHRFSCSNCALKEGCTELCEEMLRIVGDDEQVQRHVYVEVPYDSNKLEYIYNRVSNDQTEDSILAEIFPDDFYEDSVQNVPTIDDVDFSVLTDKQRSAVELYLSGNSQDEIAVELGINQPAVSRLLGRAIRRLKESNCNVMG